MSFGRMVIFIGLAIVLLGVIISLGFGRLPGDIVVRGKNSTFYFPLVTCLLLSAILSLVMWLLGRR